MFCFVFSGPGAFKRGRGHRGCFLHWICTWKLVKPLGYRQYPNILGFYSFGSSFAIFSGKIHFRRMHPKRTTKGFKTINLGSNQITARYRSPVIHIEITIYQIRHGVWYRFCHGNISGNTYNNNCCCQKLSIIQTWPGTTRFGSVKTYGFVRSANLRAPRIPVETKKTRNAICSLVHRISARDQLSGPF